MNKSKIIVLFFSLLLIIGVLVFFNNKSLSLTGYAVSGTCSGTPICNKPNANLCNGQELCRWSAGSCQVDGSCSGISDETSCNNAEGCTWQSQEAGGSSSNSTTSTASTTSGGGGTTIQGVVGISPQSPLGGDIIYQGENQLAVKVYYKGELTNSAKLKANSTMFGLVELKHLEEDPDGIYKANVTIGENVELGNNRIIYEASYSKQFNEFFMLVDVKSGLNIDIQIKDKYYKGRSMVFSGKVLDLNNSVAPNSSVTVKGIHKGIEVFNLNSVTNESGDFDISRIIKHGENAGEWEIKISAKSLKGKMGTKTLTTNVDFAEGVSYYNVHFISPLNDKEYKRGETISVSVEVKDISGNSIENAEVILSTFKGEEISLEESLDKRGIYSGTYSIEKDIKLEKHFLEVEVSKNEGSFTQVGGESIQIIVSPININFDLKSPDRELLFTNSRLKIETLLTYDDGSLVKGARPNAILSNGEVIELTEIEDGYYSGNYFVSTQDAGTLKIKIETKDINENSGVLEEIFVVRERSFIGNLFAEIYNTLLKYSWIILIFLLISGYICKDFIITKTLSYRVNRLRKKILSLKIVQKDTEKRYYEQGSISKTEFESSKKNYVENMGNMENKIKELKSTLSEKIDYIKKKD